MKIRFLPVCEQAWVLFFVLHLGHTWTCYGQEKHLKKLLRNSPAMFKVQRTNYKKRNILYFIIIVLILQWNLKSESFVRIIIHNTTSRSLHNKGNFIIRFNSTNSRVYNSNASAETRAARNENLLVHELVSTGTLNSITKPFNKRYHPVLVL